MSEHAPYTDFTYDSNRINDIDLAHDMALESNSNRSQAARARGIGRLIMEEVERGTDQFGQGAGQRIAERTRDAEETVFPRQYNGVSPDMTRTELQKVGLYGPGAKHAQLERFYDARRAMHNADGNGEKAADQIKVWSEHLDNEADKIENDVAKRD